MIFHREKETLIKGNEEQTNHNRMEIQAVIHALEYSIKHYGEEKKLAVHTDSQYVAGIPRRISKFKQNNFLTRKGEKIRNFDLIKRLVDLIENFDIEFIKVPAHLKKSAERNPNREVDKIARKIVRENSSRLRQQE